MFPTPEIHIDLLECAAILVGVIISWSHLKWGQRQNEKDLDTHKTEIRGRLEQMDNTHKKELEDVRKKHDDLNTAVREDIKAVSKDVTEMKSALARIEGVLSVNRS